ncbi:Tn3 family transposase [Streptomyces netropsis]|uniref:Tn3 family transposase n=1 Tax=Streptomyces netropsis TaxID=55404 RepID=UPI00379D3FC2
MAAGIPARVTSRGSALSQSALVHVNTLLMQQVLVDEKWAARPIGADRRALSPLFWTHVNPCGRTAASTSAWPTP